MVKIASAQARDLNVQILLMHKMAIEMYVILHLDIFIRKYITEWFLAMQ